LKGGANRTTVSGTLGGTWAKVDIGGETALTPTASAVGSVYYDRALDQDLAILVDRREIRRKGRVLRVPGTFSNHGASRPDPIVRVSQTRRMELPQAFHLSNVGFREPAKCC
jgi:hypothetical protein